MFYHKFINLYPELNQRNIDFFITNNAFPSVRAMIGSLKTAIIRWDFPKEIKDEVIQLDIPKITGKKDKKIPKFIRKSDVDRLDLGIDLGDFYSSERLRLIILTQFYAGLRISEVVGITYNHLNKERYDKNFNDKYQIITISSDSAKFGKERDAFLPTEIYVRVLQWIKKGLLVNNLKSLNKDKPIWKMGKNRYNALLLKQTKKILGEPYNSHSLRHGRGYNLRIDEKKPIDIVQKYLGHADIKSTQIYTHVGSSDVKKSMEL